MVGGAANRDHRRLPEGLDFTTSQRLRPAASQWPEPAITAFRLASTAKPTMYSMSKVVRRTLPQRFVPAAE